MVTCEGSAVEADCFNMEQLERLPVTVAQLKAATATEQGVSVGARRVATGSRTSDEQLLEPLT